MIGVSVNPNSIYIPTIQTGCLKTEFDSTYPIHLNGIISQNEFQESINNINRRISSNKILIVFAICFVLCVIAGIILFIVGGITRVNSRTYGFPVSFGVGIALFSFGPMLCVCGSCIVQMRRVAQMRLTIAEESRKYSSRSPTPCSWRLETTQTFVGGYGYNNRSHIVYHLVIDIGRSSFQPSGMYQSNQVAPISASYTGEYNNYGAPPAYSAQSIGFCSRCNKPRQDLSAKFCSSCGYSFNTY